MTTKPQTSFVSQLPPVELGENLITKSMQHLESLDQNQALEELKSIMEVRAFTEFYLGGLMSRIRDDGWHMVCGFSKFQPFLKRHVGISNDTARDYILTYYGLLICGASPTQKDEILKDIGWAKLRVCGAYLLKDTIDEWCQVAEQRNVGELRDFVDKELKKSKKLFGDPWVEHW